MCKVWAEHVLRAVGSDTDGATALMASDQLDEDLVFAGAAEEEDLDTEDTTDSEDEFGEDGYPELTKDGGALTTKEEQEIEQRLRRLRGNLGLPHARTLIKILQDSGASRHGEELRVLRLPLVCASEGRPDRRGHRDP